MKLQTLLEETRVRVPEMIQYLSARYEEAYTHLRPIDPNPYRQMVLENYALYTTLLYGGWKFEISLASGEYSNDFQYFEYDCKKKYLRVWGGGTFSPENPLGGGAAIISRIVHDVYGHYYNRLGFSPEEEWEVHLKMRKQFSPAAFPALIADDIGMGSYREVTGKWPEIQYPIVLAEG